MSLRLRIGRLSKWAALVAVALLITAAGARADGEWKIAEQTMTDLEAPEASIFGTASESFKLSVAWYASEIECSTLATEAPTKIFKGGTSEAILKLSSCQLLGPPFVSETCELIEPIELKVVGELLLHGGKTYELFKAPTGKTSLGTIKFKEGTECPLPLSNELKGTFVGETEAGERKEQPLTFNSTIEALFGGDSLSFGAHPATLKGRSTWVLAAGYKGLKWAAEGKEGIKDEEEKLNAEKEEKEKLDEEKKLKEEEEKELTEGSKWRLSRNNVSVLSLNLSIETLPFELLVPAYELAIHCEDGQGTASMQLNEAHTTLTGSGQILYEGCAVLESPFCTVKSPGQGAGDMLAKFSGTAGMNGKSVTLGLSSSEFTRLDIEGELCPLNETSEVINGTMDLTFPDPSLEAAQHSAQLDELSIGFGEHSLSMHDTKDPESAAPLHLTEAVGADWGIRLVK